MGNVLNHTYKSYIMIAVIAVIALSAVATFQMPNVDATLESERFDLISKRLGLSDDGSISTNAALTFPNGICIGICPAGPPGPAGPAGPAGPQQILQVTTRFSSFESIPSGEGRDLTAKCQPGELATGGGLTYATPFIPQNSLNPNILENSGNPDANPTEWFIRIINPGPNRVEVQAFVECAELVDAP